MKFTKGVTGLIIPVVIMDSSSTTGAWLAGLDETSGIIGGYLPMGGAGVALAVDEAVAIPGTYEAPTTAAHIRIGTPANMRPGTFELHVHNDLAATGADAVTITLGGAANMADIAILVQLTTTDPNDGVRGGMSEIATIATDVDRIKSIAVYGQRTVWYDSTGGGSAGAVVGTNGTIDNPVDNDVDLRALLASTGFKLVEVTPGSTLTLGGSYTNIVFVGEKWALDLNGQAIQGCVFYGHAMSGTCTATTPPSFRNCTINACTLPPCTITNFTWKGEITAGSAGDYHLHNPKSGVAGTGMPSFDTNALVASVNLNIRMSSGGVEVKNLGQLGTDNVSLEGFGQLSINANSVGGTIALRGGFSVSGETAFVAAGGIIVKDDTTANVESSKVKTDQMAFTVPNKLDTNVRAVNDVDLVGDGSTTPFNVA